MVGDRKRQQVVEAIKETAGKAGTLVTAAFVLAAAALALAAVGLFLALRTRRA
jgi:hypothetical protein